MRQTLIPFLFALFAAASARDYFPVRTNHSWVYDVISLKDSVPTDAGDLVYTLGEDTLVEGRRFIPRTITMREEGSNGDTMSLRIGYLLDGNPIMFTEHLPDSAELDAEVFFLQHSLRGRGRIETSYAGLRYYPYGEYETPYAMHKGCVGVADDSGRVLFILAPDVGVVGVQFEYCEVVLRRHAAGGVAELAQAWVVPPEAQTRKEDAIVLRGGHLWVPSSFSGASRILVYTADGRLVAGDSKPGSQIDVSQAGSGLRMLIVRIVLGDTVFSTKVSISR